jgi:hypothetical protein
LSLLDQTGADNAIAQQVRSLLADEWGLPDPRPNRFERAGLAIRAWYLRLAGRGWFRAAITAWFVVIGSGQLLVAVFLAADHGAIRGFEEWATVVSSGVSGGLIIVGVVQLRRHRLSAYHWFERGILVQVFVTQVFQFAQEQLAGVFGLALNLLIWISLRVMIRAELERDAGQSRAIEAEPVASLESSG